MIKLLMSLKLVLFACEVEALIQKMLSLAILRGITNTETP
jgi:hypothetical protein